MQQILAMIPPVLLSVVISDINKVVDRSLTSTLIDGSISTLNYGNRIDTSVTNIFISTFITVMLPIFSKEVNKENYKRLKKMVVNGMNVVFIITMPTTIGLIILANPCYKSCLPKRRLWYNCNLYDKWCTSFLFLRFDGNRLMFYVKPGLLCPTGYKRSYDKFSYSGWH